MSIKIVFLLVFVVLGSTTPLLPNTPAISTISPGYTQTWTFQTFATSFEVDLWRTSTFSGPTSRQPFVSFTLSSALGNIKSSTGQLFVQNNEITGLYEIDLTGSGSTYTYLIRFCPSSCPASCPVNSKSFCSNSGACLNATKACSCDTFTGNSTTPTYNLQDCSSNWPYDLWRAFLWLWILLIILFSCGICCVIVCICYCCGVCAAVAVSATEKKTLVQHVYVDAPHQQTPVYVPQPFSQAGQPPGPVNQQPQGYNRV